MRRGVIDAVWQLYDGLEERSEEELLRVAGSAVIGVCDEGLGGVCYAFDARGAPQDWTISAPVTVGAVPEPSFATIVTESFRHAPPQHRLHSFSRPVATFSERMGALMRTLPAGAATVRSIGVNDMLTLVAADPNRTGVAFAANLRRVRRSTKRERHELGQLAAHVAAAFRLRAALPAIAPSAVLDPDGAVVDHDGSASAHLPALRGVVRRLGSKHGGLDAWTALLAGRYSLVRRFDSDGRRWIVAYRNRPDVRDPRGLTPQEMNVARLVGFGHADKLVAYELGISPGTVSALLARVLRKLRVKNRTELASVMIPPTEVRDHGEVLVMSRKVAPCDGLARCTSAEREVALLAARGMTTQAIATERGVSPRTIAHQLDGVFRKLGVRTRPELARRLGGSAL